MRRKQEHREPTRKLQINFTPRMDSLLHKWKAYTDSGTDAEAIRKAVLLSALLVDHAHADSKIRLKDPDGTVMIVLL